MVVGIAVTLAGVAWVILEKENAGSEPVVRGRTKVYGILLGLGGAVGQGVGLAISKYGITRAAADPNFPLNPLSATLMRMLVAAVFLWIMIALAGKAPGVFRSFRDRKAMGQTLGGASMGPFMGVWLSMVAITYTYTGVAATLMSLMPVIVIPVIWILYRQRTSWRGLAGAAVAVAGVAILFMA